MIETKKVLAGAGADWPSPPCQFSFATVSDPPVAHPRQAHHPLHAHDVAIHTAHLVVGHLDAGCRTGQHPPPAN